MAPLGQLVRWEMLLLFSGFYGVIFWNLLTGRIPLSGLLQGDHKNGSVYSSSGRTQLLLLTLLPAMYYLTQVLQNPHVFPDIPVDLVKVIAASQSVYLAGKAKAMLNLFGRG